LSEIGNDIFKAKQILDQSGLVAIPTETVYGLAGNCFNPETIARIFEVKKRPSFDPLIVHAVNLDQICEFVDHIPEKAGMLARHFWPGPLTLILKKKEIIPDIVTSGLDTVAVRIPRHPLTLGLLKILDYPLAAPSANPFGYVSPTTAMHVEQQLGADLSYILDGGPCKVGVESTIIGFENETPVVYRLGGASVEDIEVVAGKVQIKPHSTSNPVGPGMLESHYAPMTPVVLGKPSEVLHMYPDQNIGILAFDNYVEGISQEHQYVLSEKRDLNEAATRLFTGLRHLDQLHLQRIIAEPVPDVGLGRAINDRLQRAATRN
jgi:L-threonylcarbamoyladenylate synthase